MTRHHGVGVFSGGGIGQLLPVRQKFLPGGGKLLDSRVRHAVLIEQHAADGHVGRHGPELSAHLAHVQGSG